MKITAKDVGPRDQVTPEATILNDCAVFNLQVLQVMLGQTQESIKKWIKSHNVPYLPGRSWVMSGRLLREALEPEMLERKKQRADKQTLKR